LNTIVDHKQEVSNLFYLLADFYRYPEKELLDNIKNHKVQEEMQELASQLGVLDYFHEINEWPMELEQIQRFYDESIGGPAFAVESLYKVWTTDSECTLPFAKSKGYLMGDSALHIRFILEKFEMEIPDEFKSMPDHLSTLLELLGFFIEHAQNDFIAQFLHEHFDWLADFYKKIEQVQGDTFYLQITSFLQHVIDAMKRVYLYR
jgi:putative dimethyl sulfoxide reductase chaperone